MRRKSLSFAMLGVVVVSVIGVGNASGAATTTAAEWYTGVSPGTTLAGSTGISLAIKSGTVITLESKVGTSSTPIKLTATGIECKSCTIENKEITSKAGKVAFGTGKVVFTGVTVDEPKTCAVAGERIESSSLVIHSDFMNGSTAVHQLAPGSGANFFAIGLIDGTGLCPVKATYFVSGTLFADASNATGTQTATQPINISPAVETADGGGLFIGSQSANLTLSPFFSLASGGTFGTH